MRRHSIHTLIVLRSYPRLYLVNIILYLTYCNLKLINLQPSHFRASGAMSSCCYDENDVLIYSQGSTTGSFSASSHRDGSTPYSFPGTVPYLSYLYHDVTPYLSCCGYGTADGTVDVRSCHSDFMVHRPTLNCKNDDTSRHGL